MSVQAVDVKLPHGYVASILPSRGDGTIHLLARSAFYDLILQKVVVPFPDLSGQRVLLATIHVRLDGRRPVSVEGATFNYMTFRDDGFFDSVELDQTSHFTIQTWEFPTVVSLSRGSGPHGDERLPCALDLSIVD